ncbi:22305_t:CDS:1, partial [Gigaspora rosea]
MLYEWFHDVVVNDNTCKTNIYRMLLNIFVGVDSHNQIRMLAQALVQDETQATFEWILQFLKNLNCNITPQTIFTGSNPGMAVAIYNQLPNAKHHHCLFHISQNLAKHLARKL